MGIVPTGERAAAWCARYLADVRPELAVEPDEGFLFLTPEGTKIGLGVLTRLMGSYPERSGVGKPGACHIFRHTMATVMLEGGADIRYIQRMLGHSNITSTEIYTQVSIRDLQAVHAATHPAASNKPRRLRAAASQRNGDDLPGLAANDAGWGAKALGEALDAEAAEERGELA
ncbi:MAG: tyrosine-type recombinase/integrase [Actinobacteria bacterium]|nr:tyrosine-type recombinase/integrase [Actinomycetota bacterium]